MVILVSRMTLKLALWQNLVVFIGYLLSLRSPSSRFIVLGVGRISLKFTTYFKLSLRLKLFSFLG